MTVEELEQVTIDLWRHGKLHFLCHRLWFDVVNSRNERLGKSPEYLTSYGQYHTNSKNDIFLFVLLSLSIESAEMTAYYEKKYDNHEK
jgi:hypothetical protein